MVKFGDKFGLPKDRKKLEGGITNISIFKIQIVKSKKLYDVTEENPETGKIEVKKKLIEIAYFDAHPYEMNGEKVAIDKKETLKYYSPNGAIVEACKDFVQAFGAPLNGEITTGLEYPLSQSVEIEKVGSKSGEKSKNPYLYFTDNEIETEN
jgi:hypothetical protein